jgi:hypothetical protein
MKLPGLSQSALTGLMMGIYWLPIVLLYQPLRLPDQKTGVVGKIPRR